jgi:pyridoxine kinase
MARVLSISSQTVYGPVGNSAAVPALQAMGHEVLALPTILLSNHPGHGAPVTHVTSPDLLIAMLDKLESLGAFENLNAILTGYFSSESQVIAATERIATLKAKRESLQVLVDPVLGDHGRLYVPQAVAEAIRSRLLSLATITTPNLFELTWLTGEVDLEKAIAKLAVTETIVTSAPATGGALATLLHTSKRHLDHITPKQKNMPHGTGDFLAGAYLAERLLAAPEQAFPAAMRKLDRVIAASAGSAVLHPNPS